MVGARGVGVGGLGILTRRSLTGGGGGTADALASGASEGNLVEVQILSAAPATPYAGRVPVYSPLRYLNDTLSRARQFILWDTFLNFMEANCSSLMQLAR